MAQDDAKPAGPDLSQGIPSISLPMANCWSVMLATKTSYWRGGEKIFSWSGRIARTTRARLPTAS